MAKLFQDLDNIYLKKNMHNKNYVKIINENFRMKFNELLNNYIIKFLFIVVFIRIIEKKRLY